MGLHNSLSGGGESSCTTKLFGHMDQIRKKIAQMMGMVCTFLIGKSYPSVWNGVLLYKQLIRPMINYSCPA